MIEIHEQSGEGIVGFTVHGKVSVADVEEVGRKVDEIIEKSGGKLTGMVCDARDFDGYETVGALMKDFRFIKDHHMKIGKVAVVCSSKWLKLMADILRPLVKAEQKYFEAGQLDEAWQWVRS